MNRLLEFEPLDVVADAVGNRALFHAAVGEMATHDERRQVGARKLPTKANFKLIDGRGRSRGVARAKESVNFRLHVCQQPGGIGIPGN